METERVLAFEHTTPAYPVHVVVVPKEHTPSLVDLGDGGEGLLGEVMAVVRQVAARVEAEHGAASADRAPGWTALQWAADRAAPGSRRLNRTGIGGCQGFGVVA